MSTHTLHLGDCLEVLRTMPDCSVDACVTDPPYGLSFMGKVWDYDVPGVDVWREVLRVLKPGGHLLAFAGTRTQHRMAVAIEDAGFEIRDMIAWVYGSGFPKSLDVSKAIDKAAGAEREVVESVQRPAFAKGRGHGRDESGAVLYRGINGGHEGVIEHQITAPATPEAQQWAGWGTALKPALEPITMARRPLVGTVAANVLEHGTGALNIDGCRVGAETMVNPPAGTPGGNSVRLSGGDGRDADNARWYAEQSKQRLPTTATGRWPANLILTYPEDEYKLKDNITPQQLSKLAEWMNENS